jgi:hypothetical protein
MSLTMDSLKFHPGPPCPTLLRPPGGPPLRRPCFGFRGGPPAGAVGGWRLAVGGWRSSIPLDTPRRTAYANGNRLHFNTFSRLKANTPCSLRATGMGFSYSHQIKLHKILIHDYEKHQELGLPLELLAPPRQFRRETAVHKAYRLGDVQDTIEVLSCNADISSNGGASGSTLTSASLPSCRIENETEEWTRFPNPD